MGPGKYRSLRLGSCPGWFQRIQQLLFHLILTGCLVCLLHISLVTLTVDQRRNAVKNKVAPASPPEVQASKTGSP